MPAATYDFTIEKGATFTRTITWRADATPVDLTGYTARMHIRRTVSSPTVLLELTTENGRITLGGAAGTIAWAMSATDTAALPGTGGVYDLELVNPSGTVYRMLQGEIEFVPEVTR